MNAFSDDRGPISARKINSGWIGSAESECKPDYEKLILSIKKMNKVALALQASLEEYLEVCGGFSSSTAAQIVGALYLETRQRDKEIERLIEAQARDAAK
jgi:hypothetical protein